MYLDVRVEGAFGGELAAGRALKIGVAGWREFLVNLVVLKHARFHWRRKWRTRNVGAFCGGCEESLPV